MFQVQTSAMGVTEAAWKSIRVEVKLWEIQILSVRSSLRHGPVMGASWRLGTKSQCWNCWKGHKESRQFCSDLRSCELWVLLITFKYSLLPQFQFFPTKGFVPLSCHGGASWGSSQVWQKNASHIVDVHDTCLPEVFGHHIFASSPCQASVLRKPHSVQFYTIPWFCRFTNKNIHWSMKQ